MSQTNPPPEIMFQPSVTQMKTVAAPTLTKVDETVSSDREKVVDRTQTVEGSPPVQPEQEPSPPLQLMQSVTAVGDMEGLVPPQPNPVKRKATVSKPQSKHSRGKMQKKKLNKKESAEKLDIDDDEGSMSEDIIVVQTEENEVYLNQVIVGKLSRLGQRKTLWSTKAQSFFVIFSFLISFQTLSDFFVVFDRFGPWFMLSYVLLVIFFAVPMMYFEMALGQYTSSTVCVVFERMAPAFMGIGIAALAYNFIMTVSDGMIILQFIKLVMQSVMIMGSEMPYHNCMNFHNTLECQPVVHPSCEEINKELEENSLFSRSDREQTGLRYVAMGDVCIQARLLPMYKPQMEPLRLDTMGFSQWMTALPHNQFANWDFDYDKATLDFFPPVTHLVGYCFSWFLVFYVCLQSEKFITRMTKVTMQLSLSAFLTLIVAILFFNPPEYPFIYSLNANDDFSFYEMWLRTVILVIRMFKLGQGGFIFLGAQNDIHNPILPDCLIIATVMSTLPLLFGIVHLFVTDSFLLGMFDGDRDAWYTAAENAANHPVYKSGNQVVQFSIFALSMSSLGSYETFILAIFSIAGILIVISHKIVHIHMIAASIVEFAFESTDFSLVLTAVIFAASLFTLLFLGGRGFEMIVSMDNILIPMLGLTIIFCEVLAVIVYGPHRFFANLMFISNRRNASDKWRHLKQYINVSILFLVLIGVPLIVVVQIGGVYLAKNTTASWAFVICLFLSVAGIIPTVAYFKMTTQHSKYGDFYGLFVPNRDLWGPRSSADREIAEIVERELQFRGFRWQKKNKK